MSAEEESMAFDEKAEHAIYKEQDLVRDFGESPERVPSLVDDWLRSARRGSSREPTSRVQRAQQEEEITR